MFVGTKPVATMELELWSQTSAFKARRESKRAKSLFVHEKRVSQRMGNLERGNEIEILSYKYFQVEDS